MDQKQVKTFSTNIQNFQEKRLFNFFKSKIQKQSEKHIIQNQQNQNSLQITVEKLLNIQEYQKIILYLETQIEQQKILNLTVKFYYDIFIKQINKKISLKQFQINFLKSFIQLLKQIHENSIKIIIQNTQRKKIKISKNKIKKYKKYKKQSKILERKQKNRLYQTEEAQDLPTQKGWIKTKLIRKTGKNVRKEIENYRKIKNNKILSKFCLNWALQTQNLQTFYIEKAQMNLGKYLNNLEESQNNIYEKFIKKIQLCIELLKMLVQFQKNSFVHRDFKADNICIKQNIIYIIDLQGSIFLSEELLKPNYNQIRQFTTDLKNQDYFKQHPQEFYSPNFDMIGFGFLLAQMFFDFRKFKQSNLLENQKPDSESMQFCFDQIRRLIYNCTQWEGQKRFSAIQVLKIMKPIKSYIKINK